MTGREETGTMEGMTSPLPATNPLTGKATAPTEAPVEHAPLTLADRCCSCRAQAFVAVWMPEATDPLLFCGHHFGRHESALIAQGAVRIEDERSRINEKPTEAQEV